MLVSNGFSNSGAGAPQPAREPASEAETVEHDDADEQSSDEETS